MKCFLNVIDCTQQLQVRENVVGFEKALGAVKVIKDQIQYRSQSLLNLASGHFTLGGGGGSESMDQRGCAILALEVVPKNLIFA